MTNATLETAASHLARLGVPPDDIAQAWLDDAQRHAVGNENGDSNTFGSPRDPLDPSDPVWETLLVDETGRLVPVINSESTERGTGHRLDSTPDRLRNAEPRQPKPFEASNDPETISPPTRSLRKPIAIATGTLVLILAAGALWFRPTSPTNADGATAIRSLASKRKSETSNPFNTSGSYTPSRSNPSQSSTPARASTQPRLRDTEELETISPEFEITPNSTALGSDLLGGTVSLDSFFPGDDKPINLDASDSASKSEMESGRDITGSGMSGSTDETADAVPALDIDLQIAAPESGESIDIAETESETETMEGAVSQPTTVTLTTAAQSVGSKTIAVELPPLPADDDELPSIVLLTGSSTPKNLQLEFPGESRLRLVTAENSERWTVQTDENQEPIATIAWGVGDATDGLVFQWQRSAAESSLSKTLAKTLAEGRILTDSGDIVYLRPQFDAQPIALNLASKDEKLKWSLGATVPIGLANLSIEVNVPDDVELKWIEPIDPAAVRNSRCIGMLSLKDSPDAGAIVVRIDLRTSSSLTMRIRVGGRLDPSLPWQWTNAKTIRQSLDALTGQLQSADGQLLRLDVAISQAKKIRARRQEAALEMQRDQIESNVKIATVMAKRLAELDQLVALLDADAHLTANVSVTWPDGQSQTLLNVLSPNR